MLKIAVLAFLLTIRPPAPSSAFFDELSAAALSLTHQKVTYDPAYVSIPYPGGDVAPDKGVCTDVVIRAYRRVGIDLQREVHQDMTAHFDVYPKIWGLKKADANIDHRRVQNLQVFFSRHGASLPVSQRPEDYRPGDIVTWYHSENGSNFVHIGMLVDRISPVDKKRHMIVHNIGRGQELSDCLFDFRITGHYRYRKSNG